MVLVAIASIAFFSILLIRSAGFVSTHLRALARKTSMSSFLVTSLLLGFATSLPELFVGITSSLDGQPSISLGNAIGSNIVDVSLVVGLAVLFAGKLKISKNGGQAKDLAHAFVAALVPFFLMIDEKLSRVDGLVLIVLYGVYNYIIIHKREDIVKRTENPVISFWKRFVSNGTGKHVLYVLIGVAAMLISADMMVKMSTVIALEMGVTLFSIGLVVVAMGTSLPELAFEVSAVRKKEPEMFMGNILGSIVANSTLIVGLTALISPIHLARFSEYILSIIFFVLIFGVFSRTYLVPYVKKYLSPLGLNCKRNF